MKRWLTILAAVCVVGCAHYQPQPLTPEKTAAQLEARRLDDPLLKAFLEQNLGHSMTNWPMPTWHLPELTLAAFHFHPSLAVARAQWLVASAGVRTAAARPNPTVSVAPAYDTQIPGNFSPWTVPVAFDLPLETAGKRDKRMALAEQNAEAARWDFVSAAWQIRSGVRGAMLDYEFGQRKTSLLQQQFEQLKKISAVMQQRLDAGDIARPDVIAAQINLNKTQHDLSDARAGAADARARLAAAIGLPEAALDGIQIVFNPVDDGAALTSAEARRLALTSRADVRSALADYAAAEADLRLQIAKQYPDIHIGPGYQWNSGQAGDSEWILGLNLELPLLDRNQGPIAEAEARRKLAAARFVELQSQIISQIDRAAAALRVAREQWRIGSDLIASEEKQQRAAQAQVQAGAGGQIDLLTAQVEITSASLAQLDNEAKIQAALSGLEDALQRPAGNIAAAIATISK